MQRSLVHKQALKHGMHVMWVVLQSHEPFNASAELSLLQRICALSQADSRAGLQAGEVAGGMAMGSVCRGLRGAVQQIHACTTSRPILLLLLLLGLLLLLVVVLLRGKTAPSVLCSSPTVMIPIAQALLSTPVNSLLLLGSRIGRTLRLMLRTPALPFPGCLTLARPSLMLVSSGWAPALVRLRRSCMAGF